MLSQAEEAEQESILVHQSSYARHKQERKSDLQGNLD